MQLVTDISCLLTAQQSSTNVSPGTTIISITLPYPQQPQSFLEPFWPLDTAGSDDGPPEYKTV